MATYTQIIYHIVFATKLRQAVLTKSRRDDLYRFLWGVLKNRQSHLFRIGGIEDHVHILTSIHSTMALSDLVKELKTASSAWIKGEHVFPDFTYWQEGYGAFTHALPDKARLIEYIKNQEQHHQTVTFREEYDALFAGAGLEVDARDEMWFDE